MTRYAKMFERLSAKNEGAFVPFWMLGDPNPELSLRRIELLIENGADALELGIPFSDPVADGPVVQLAAMRALKAGTKVSTCFDLIGKLRAKYPEISIGVLTYANLVIHHGEDWFYAQAAKAGVDSVLVADVPTLEAAVFCEAAVKVGVDPVMILPPNASEEQLEAIAKFSKGYVYGVTRAGVTGADERVALSSKRLIERLAELGAPPVMLGFGISKPEHVKAALAEGAAGAISGSAVVQLGLSNPKALPDFIRAMKAASKT